SSTVSRSARRRERIWTPEVEAEEMREDMQCLFRNEKRAAMPDACHPFFLLCKRPPSRRPGAAD
ncbi:hypothetical protein, partial [uncultured Ralstonia sp.]|uniref:hypothetical protein n=1 Tax=uncultured Ralstonia sp. TaxID=114715 RepID=UPI0025E606BB